jgi:hypothetical protein
VGIISSMRRQAAVYWAPDTPDDFGLIGAATPVDIACRWEDVSEAFITSEGVETTSRAKVYVDRDLLPGGYLYLGQVSDLPDPAAHPRTVDGAYMVQSFDKLPNLKATEYLRTAML